MKRLFLLVTISALMLFSAGTTRAQIGRDITKVGTTAAQFLKIGPGARALGMGGAYTAVSDDIYSVYYNPAGIARTSGGAAAFNHSEWLADMKYDFAAASVNIEDMGVLFFSLTSYSSPEEKVRTFENPEGDGRYWDASALAIGAGYSRALTDRFSIGFHFKYIQESIWDSKASGFGLDVGTYYVTPFNDLVIGASISNFGSKMKLDGRDIQFNMDPNGDATSGPNNVPALLETDSYDIPLTFRIGLAMDVLKTRFIRVKTALDASHPNDNTEYVNAGVEVAYDEMFFVRGGYKSLFLQDSEQGLTLGAGLKYEVSPGFNVQVNYGYADYGRLKDIQYFDLGITF